MPDRVLELFLPKRNLLARAAFLEHEAPHTCQMLWDRLPLQAQTTHVIVSGCELFVLFPWDRPPPPRENFTVCPDAGDLFFFFAPWYSTGAQPAGEIAVYYDRDAIPMGGSGMTADSLFASITQNRPAFAAACEAIWREGAETLILRRAECSA